MSQPIPLRPARRRAASSPTLERGYVTRDTGAWWSFDPETTPELMWPVSVEVFDKMRKQDGQVQSVLRAVTLPVKRTPWRLNPAGARDEVVALLAEDLGMLVKGQDEEERPRRMRDRFSWSEHLRLALLMTTFGHMFFEQVYRLDPDGPVPYRLKKLAPRWPRTIAKVNVARDGGLVGIEQHPAAGDLENVPLDVDRLVAYVLDREGANWIGTSLLRTCYKNWLLKDRLLRVWAQTIDRNGMGLPWYTAAEGEDLAKGEAIARQVRAGDSSGGAGPNGSMMQLLGVQGTLPDAERAVRYQDEQIARSVLAHYLNLNAQGGSYALASVQADTFFGSLNGLAQDVCDTANAHVVEDWVDLNFGPDEPAPRIEFQPIGQDTASIVDMVKILLDSGATFADPKLDSYMRDLVGLPPRQFGAGAPGNTRTPPPPATEETPNA